MRDAEDRARDRGLWLAAGVLAAGAYVGILFVLVAGGILGYAARFFRSAWW